MGRECWKSTVAEPASPAVHALGSAIGQPGGAERGPTAHDRVVPRETKAVPALRVHMQRERHAMATERAREAEAILDQHPGVRRGVPQEGRRGRRRDVRVERGQPTGIGGVRARRDRRGYSGPKNSDTCTEVNTTREAA